MQSKSRNQKNNKLHRIVADQTIYRLVGFLLLVKVEWSK